LLSSQAELIELSTSNGRITINPSIGRIDLYINATDTANLTGGGGVYDLEIYFSGGDTIRLCSGLISFSEQVTR
jgi:hypothetical protein